MYIIKFKYHTECLIFNYLQHLNQNTIFNNLINKFVILNEFKKNIKMFLLK